MALGEEHMLAHTHMHACTSTDMCMHVCSLSCHVFAWDSASKKAICHKVMQPMVGRALFRAHEMLFGLSASICEVNKFLHK
jgi:hypothetical protein